MPNTIQLIARQLRSLPFTDMMVLVEHLQAELAACGAVDVAQVGSIRPTTMAKVLCALDGCHLELSDQSKQEEKILEKVFTRKRVITVKRDGTGWGIMIPTISGSHVIGTELRPMFDHMLDQIITLHALGKM